MKINQFPNQLQNLLGVLMLVMTGASASAQVPVIASLSRNGELVCTNIQPGTTASVEWASSVLGPWTNTWAGLDSLTVDSNGLIQVRVPMFYRVRGVSAAPAGMVLIPGGPFAMGDAFPDHPPAEWSVHTVQVSGFYMDKYEVTKALWDEVYQWAITNGYSFEAGAQGKATNHPAHSMTWYDAVKWCNARSEKEGRTPAYYTNAAQTKVYRSEQINLQNEWVRWNAGYRLPTEAEWEKAARGGLSGRRFPWGDVISHTQANYNGHPYSNFDYDLGPEGYHPTYEDGTFRYTSPVGAFAANSYGLHDMAGNVSEWCWDWYGDTYHDSSPEIDPRGPVTGPPGFYHLIRGGSWYDQAYRCRVAERVTTYAESTFFTLGFRAILSQNQ